MNAYQYLQKAIALCGGKSGLAKSAGLKSRQVIDNALRRKSVSPELALAVERATSGLVTKEQLVWGDIHSERRAA